MTAAYPLHLRTILRANKARKQLASFALSEPRRGPAYVQEIGTDTPVFWDVTFGFTQVEAQSFRLWFIYSINRGADEFTMPIRTEFGVLDHVCRFMPDGLLDMVEQGEVFTYRAQIMTRAEVIPADIAQAGDLLGGLPAWPDWAALLDQAMSARMPV